MANLPSRFTNPNTRKSAAPQSYRTGGIFTAFSWENQPLGFAKSVSVQSAQPMAPPVAIQPMDATHPDEIITTAAVGPVTLTVQLFERYQSRVWDDIMAVLDKASPQTGSRSQYIDLQAVFMRLAAAGRGITMTKFIYPPSKIQQVRNQYYAETYQDCKIVDIRDDENIEVTTMDIVKQMTVMATKTIPHVYNS